MMFKITIIKRDIPESENINEKLMWLGGSLGLFGIRDKDKSCFRIFIELLKQSRRGVPISSDNIAENLNLSRGTVIHHINRMIESGIIISKNNRYYLRISSLSSLVDKVKEDIEKQLDEIKDVAKDIDNALEI
ncbi:MAG: winged helix-turn-helix domain-containing protein [Nanobdellota archaeon]